MLKGLRDPGRSYENLLADSPPGAAPLAEAAVLSTPPSQALSQQPQQPWSLLMRRQLVRALTQGSTPGEASRGGERGLSAQYANSPDSPLSSCAHTSASKAISAQLRASSGGASGGGVLLAAVVRQLMPAELARGAKEVLVVAPDKRTLLVVRPGVFQGAEAEHVAAAAAAYGQTGWATRYKFHLCLKGTDTSRTTAIKTTGSDSAATATPTGAGAAEVEAELTGKTAAAMSAIASSLADSVLGGQSSAFFVYGAPGSGSNACFLESVAGAGDGVAPVAFREVVEAIFSRVDSSADTLISMSCLDICGEHISDLQADAVTATGSTENFPSETDNSVGGAKRAGTLRLREHPADGPYVACVKHVGIASPEEAVTALQAAHARHQERTHGPGQAHFVAVLELRHKGSYAEEARTATAQNLDTDRGGNGKAGTARIVRLYMVQLAHAPSESSTVVASASMQSVRRSLHTLGQVLSSIGRVDGALKQALPYRDSTLTWLLKDALAGPGIVSVLATLSPTEKCYEESLATAKLVAQWAPHDLQAPRTIQLGGGGGGSAGNSGGKGAGRSDKDKNKEEGRDWELAQCATSPGGSTISFQSAIEKLHEGLGASAGSAASRTLLQAVVSDPQQKAGKAGTGTGTGTGAGAGAGAGTGTGKSASSRSQFHPMMTATTPPHHSGDSSPGTHITLGDVGGLEGIRERCRTLQATLLETQLELDCARTDRDSLQADLNSARAGLVHAAGSPSGQPSSQQARRAGLKLQAEAEQLAATSSAQLEAAQRELRTLKSVLLRKEEALENVAEDLRCEQVARKSMETAAESTVRGCLQRFGDMQTRINELEEAEARALIQANDASVTVRTLRDAVSGQVHSAVQVSDSLEKQLLAERKKIGNASLEVQSLQQQLREARDTIAAMNEALVAAEEIHHIESARERTEAAQKLAALQEQYSSLQRAIALKEGSLHGLLVSGGSSLQHKTEDARQLMHTVASLREGMVPLPQVLAELAEEKARRKDEGEKAQALLRRQMTALQDLTGKADYWQALAKKQRHYIEKMEAAYTDTIGAQHASSAAVLEAQEQARQWQRRTEEAQAALEASRTSAAEGGETLQRLSAAEAAVEKQRREAFAAQAAMQEEYATLWVAVQDLNKLDASKEAAIGALLQEQQQGRTKLKQAQSAYAALQRELTAIDDELLDAARAEGLGDMAGRIVRLRENVREPVHAQVAGVWGAVGTEHPAVATELTPLRTQQLNTSAAALLAQRNAVHQVQAQVDHHRTPRSRSRSPMNSKLTHSSRSNSSSADSTSSLVMFAQAKAYQDELHEQDLCRTLDDINEMLERSPPRNVRRHASPPRLPASVQSASSSSKKR